MAREPLVSSRHIQYFSCHSRDNRIAVSPFVAPKSGSWRPCDLVALSWFLHIIFQQTSHNLIIPPNSTTMTGISYFLPYWNSAPWSQISGLKPDSNYLPMHQGLTGYHLPEIRDQGLSLLPWVPTVPQDFNCWIDNRFHAWAHCPISILI